MSNYEKRRLEEIRKAHQQRKGNTNDAKSKQNILFGVSVVLVVAIAWYGKSMFTEDAQVTIEPQVKQQWKAPEPITLSKDVIIKKKLEEKRRRERKTTEKNFTLEDEPATPEMMVGMKQDLIDESNEEIDFFQSRLRDDKVLSDPDLKARTKAHLERAVAQRKWYDKIDPKDRSTWGYFDK